MAKSASDASVFVAYQRQADSETSSNEEDNPSSTQSKQKPRKKNRKKKGSERSLLKELAMCKIDKKKGGKNQNKATTVNSKPPKQPAVSTPVVTAEIVQSKQRDSHRNQVSELQSVVLMLFPDRNCAVLCCLMNMKTKLTPAYQKTDNTKPAFTPTQGLEASSVSALMSELLLTKKQNAQLLENQQRLIAANAKINDQYQQSQGIQKCEVGYLRVYIYNYVETIAQLRNELIFLHEVCMSSQNEVSLLKAAASISSLPTHNANPHRESRKVGCRPPPGIL
uniref:AlNc14C170G7980 protein n=1 Tax=Albugo laibachii Nc14 TaxID=890382 RepID=F0WNF3_9STRA|nr:AlNc14C170G7980 [Albugo laibachii Nc14]|eukprot:CCA22844.1 AlNc14C170G7980 [Albugo laibachii Nc14]